jgi:hypothetical protein
MLVIKVPRANKITQIWFMSDTMLERKTDTLRYAEYFRGFPERKTNVVPCVYIILK